MSYDTQKGREDLLAFEREQPDNSGGPTRTCSAWSGTGRARTRSPPGKTIWIASAASAPGPSTRLFARTTSTTTSRCCAAGGPTAIASRKEVEHHPSYHEAGRFIYGSGVMTALGEAGGNLRSQTLGFLSALNGEAGQPARWRAPPG